MAVARSRDIFDAAANNDVDAVKHFIEKGKIATTTKNDADETPAHIAARTGGLETVKYLLSKNAELTKAVDIHGNTVLDLAAQVGALSLVEFLLTDKKMDVLRKNRRRQENTVVHIAAEAGQLQVLKYLFDKYKLDVNLPNDMKQTALLLAARNGHLEVIKYLIEHCQADATLVNSYEENILLMCAENGDLALPRYLLDEKKIELDIDDRDDKRGETALQRAVRFNHLPFVKYLVEEKGANPNSRDYYGRSALHEAAVKGDLKTVKYLVERAGAKLDLLDLHKRDPLFTALDEDVIEYLNKTMRSTRARRSVPDASTFSLLNLSPASSSFSPLQLWRTGHEIQMSARESDVGGTGSGAFSRFLAFASIFAQSDAKSRRGRLVSPNERLSAKIDPVALDVVYDSKFDFE